MGFCCNNWQGVFWQEKEWVEKKSLAISWRFNQESWSIPWVLHPKPPKKKVCRGVFHSGHVNFGTRQALQLFQHPIEYLARTSLGKTHRPFRRKENKFDSQLQLRLKYQECQWEWHIYQYVIIPIFLSWFSAYSCSLQQVPPGPTNPPLLLQSTSIPATASPGPRGPPDLYSHGIAGFLCLGILDQQDFQSRCQNAMLITSPRIPWNSEKMEMSFWKEGSSCKFCDRIGLS